MRKVVRYIIACLIIVVLLGGVTVKLSADIINWDPFTKKLPMPAGPHSVLIGPVYRDYIYNAPIFSISPTATHQVYIAFSADLVGISITFTIIGNGNGNGSASISGQNVLTPPDTDHLNGTLTIIAGNTQTAVGNAGNLFIIAKDPNGKLIGKSPGFSVCAHPIDISKTVAFNFIKNINGLTFEGIKAKCMVDSDYGGRDQLDQVFFKESVERDGINKIGLFQNGVLPEITVQNKLLQASNIYYDKIALTAPEFYSTMQGYQHDCGFTKCQCFLFTCKRCGLTSMYIQVIYQSGNWMTHSFFYNNPTNFISYNAFNTPHNVDFVDLNGIERNSLASCSKTGPAPVLQGNPFFNLGHI